MLQRGKVEPMADNVVNLNRFRKQKAREEKAKQAAINRVKHGRTKAQKERERADLARATKLLEGKRLEHDAAPDDDGEKASDSDR